MVSWMKHEVDRVVIVSIFIPKLRLILILISFLGSSDSLLFFFNYTATTEIYTLSLHDALPIFAGHGPGREEALELVLAHALARGVGIQRHGLDAHADARPVVLHGDDQRLVRGIAAAVEQLERERLAVLVRVAVAVVVAPARIGEELLRAGRVEGQRGEGAVVEIALGHAVARDLVRQPAV